MPTIYTQKQSIFILFPLAIAFLFDVSAAFQTSLFGVLHHTNGASADDLSWFVEVNTTDGSVIPITQLIEASQKTYVTACFSTDMFYWSQFFGDRRGAANNGGDSATKSELISMTAHSGKAVISNNNIQTYSYTDEIIAMHCVAPFLSQSQSLSTSSSSPSIDFPIVSIISKQSLLAVQILNPTHRNIEYTPVALPYPWRNMNARSVLSGIVYNEEMQPSLFLTTKTMPNPSAIIMDFNAKPLISFKFSCPVAGSVLQIFTAEDKYSMIFLGQTLSKEWIVGRFTYSYAYHQMECDLLRDPLSQIPTTDTLIAADYDRINDELAIITNTGLETTLYRITNVKNALLGKSEVILVALPENSHQFASIHYFKPPMLHYRSN